MEEIHTSPEKPKKKRPVSADGQERPRKRPADEGDAPRPRKRSDRWRRYTEIKETRNESRRAGRIASTKTPDKYGRICKAEETCFAGRKEVRQEAPQKKQRMDTLSLVLLLVAIVVFCFSAFSLIRIGLNYKKGTDTYQELEAAVVTEATPDGTEAQPDNADTRAMAYSPTSRESR